jgi:hypothetical protein
VTSERTDVDYLFHKSSAKSLHALIRNLRQSNFFWTGWSRDDILSAMGHSLKYLQDEDSQKATTCSREDRILLNQCVNFGETVIRSPGWNAMSVFHELGLFVNDWPDESIQHWSLRGIHTSFPTIVGASHLAQAQKHVNARLSTNSPTTGLADRGVVALQAAKADAKQTKPSANTTMKMGVPIRSGEVNHASPKKSKRGSRISVQKAPKDEVPLPSSVLQAENVIVESGSSIAVPAIVGTTSSKMSYLLERVMALHLEEKILIFYDAENTAYYIAQCLELMHIKHLIYAKTLTAEQRSKWIVSFDTDDSIRVILMVRELDVENQVLARPAVYIANLVDYYISSNGDMVCEINSLRWSTPDCVNILYRCDNANVVIPGHREWFIGPECQQGFASVLHQPTLQATPRSPGDQTCAQDRAAETSLRGDAYTTRNNRRGHVQPEQSNDPRGARQRGERAAQ